LQPLDLLLRPEQIVDGLLVEAESAIGTPRQQGVGVRDPHDLSCVAAGKPIDTSRVAPWGDNERVRPRALRPEPVVLELDCARGLDDPRLLEAAGEHAAR
jgi:hypothetical protein